MSTNNHDFSTIRMIYLKIVPHGVRLSKLLTIISRLLHNKTKFFDTIRATHIVQSFDKICLFVFEHENP